MLSAEDLKGSIEVIPPIEDFEKYNFQCVDGDEINLPTEGVGAGSTCMVFGSNGISKVLQYSAKLKEWRVV